LAWGIQGGKYRDYQELFPLVLKENHIDIKEIVYQELVNQVDSAGGLKRVDKNGDFVIKTIIAQYGYFGVPLTKTLAPKITLFLYGSLRNGKKVWESQGKVSTFSKLSVAHDATEMVNKPVIIRQDFEKLTKPAVEEALKSYNEQIIHSPQTN